MAENESLDLTHCNNKRWKRLNRLVQEKRDPSEVSERFERCVRQLLNQLLQGDTAFPLEQLLHAADRGDLPEIHRIVREVRRHKEYALLFNRYAPLANGSGARGVCNLRLEAIVNRFWDQFQYKSIGAPQWRDIGEFKEYRQKIDDLLMPRIDGLAAKLVANPTVPPRQLPRSAAKRAAAEKQLLTQSLLSESMRTTVPVFAKGSP